MTKLNWENLNSNDMVEHIKQKKAEWLTAEYTTYYNINMDSIYDKLEELKKKPEDIEDVFIKWWFLKVLFEGESEYVDLIEAEMSEWDLKRPEKVEAY